MLGPGVQLQLRCVELRHPLRTPLDPVPLGPVDEVSRGGDTHIAILQVELVPGVLPRIALFVLEVPVVGEVLLLERIPERQIL